ncbi:hypothetical protein ACFVUW_19295 [Streptomyces xiamenensis]|uniref:hypothetical protein n=1 Tax=Streptomyces xiamenensis TaxID=408015 RepID=UPI0036E69D6F
MARTESGKQPLPEQQHTKTPAATSAPLPAAALHQLQRSAGNAAVARLVAQRYTPPVKPPPAQAPGLRRVNADIGAKRQKLSAHPAPTAESRAAQDAAVAPPDDKQAQAKTQQAEKMNAAEPGNFDKAAFITAVNQAVEAQAPKNLDEADNFSDSGNADRIKDEVDGQVTDGAESSAEDIATTTEETPDTSTATDKEVTPLSADQPPGNPGAPNASDAVPERQPEEVTDFSEGQRDTEQQMADADVTEEQLARGNEPDFDNALSEKKQGEEETAAAPGQARAAENAEIQTAKSGAAAAGAQAMAGLTATRQETGAQVDSGKTETKSEDEKKREQVTAKLQKVFDDTKTDVEKTLDGLDDKVDTQFTNGEKRARDDFTADHERRMKAYKDKRYSGLRGKARWVKDKFTGLPDEANDLYQESRKLYVNRMQGVISDIADTIGRELGRAKSRIERGRTELQAEVEKLPADLRRFGEEAAADFSGQFDDLETTVDEKSEQLVQDLAQKYTEALDAIDEEIKALQEANKGLWDRIKDAVVGVIQTIIELTNALMGILAKAASAVSKIIKDPIGFLGNVVRFVGDGLNLFTANIEQHLKTGLVSWLLGTAVKTGLEIPAKFDAKGIVQLLASLLGLTWDTIRAKIVRKGVPDKAMATVEKTIPEAQALQREGPAGLTKDITGESGDLKKTILDDLKSYLIPTVIVAGIAWIVSLLTPASAFVRAVKGIIDIVTFIVTQAAQITDFMNAILDAVIAIADGAAAGVPKLIESALSTSIPVLLGFLAALLGIGSLANKVRSVFQKVSRPVGRAIDKIIDRIAKAGKRAWRKFQKNPGSGGKKSQIDSKKDLGPVGDNIRWTVDDESHRLWIDQVGQRYIPMLASTPHPVDTAISAYRARAADARTDDASVVSKIDIADGDLTALKEALAEYKAASQSGASVANLQVAKKEIKTAQTSLQKSVLEVQKSLGLDSDAQLKKARNRFGMDLFSTGELADFLGVSKTTAERIVRQWIIAGVSFRVQSHEKDPQGKNTFDPAAAEWRETHPNNRQKYGYTNPSKASRVGLEILSKGLLGTRGPKGKWIPATASQKLDAAYHQDHAHYKSVMNPEKYSGFKFPEAILGHAPPGASGHWNRYGHKQTREENRAWNQLASSYHGPEHKEESAASGAEAERYNAPTAKSHESWLKGE